MKILALSIIAACSLSSCATLFTGSKCKVFVPDSEQGQKAKVFLDGSYVGETPIYVKMSKSDLKESVVSIQADGCKPLSVKVGRKPMVGIIIADAVINPIIGLGVDFLDGDVYRPRTKQINYFLEKE